MQKDIVAYTIPPAPKTQRGYVSSIDVNQHHILYFNGATVVLLPQDPVKPVLNIVHLTDIVAAKFSPDGRLVASLEAKGTLLVHQICPDRLILVKQYENFLPSGKALDWSADGKRICGVGQAKGNYGRVVLYETGTNAGELTGVIGSLNSCSFRPQRPFKLVLGGDQMTLKFYDGPPYAFKQSDNSHKGFINQLKYSPKGTYILTGGADRKLTLHDGLKYQRIIEKQNAHNGGIFGLDWIDEQHFVTCSSDKLIKVWNIKMEQLSIIQTGSPEDMKNPKKIELFLVGIRVFKDTIYAINLQSNILVYKNPLTSKSTTLIKTFYGAKSKISNIIVFSDSEVILLDSGGRILVYSLLKSKVKALVSPIQIKNIVTGFLQTVQSFKELFVLHLDGTTSIYRTQKAAIDFSLHKKLTQIELKNISNFQKQTITGVTTNSLIIYDTSKQAAIKQLAFKEDITFLQSNHSFILVGTLKGKVIIYNADLAEIANIQLATFKISTIKLIDQYPAKANENLALLGDSLATMKLIRVHQNGIQILKDSMGGHSSLITSADSDEKWIYTFSMDGKINLWNRQTLAREKEMNEIVKGGILFGASVKDRLFVAGGDMLVKVIPKKY